MHVSRGAQSTLELYAVRAEAVFNRVPYYSATKTTLFRVGREARPRAFESRSVPRPERLVCVVASGDRTCM